MKLSLEDVPTDPVCPQIFPFLTLCPEEANGVSKAANSRRSLQLYCLHIFCACHTTEQSCGDPRAWFSVGCFHAVVDWPVTSLKIMCKSALLQWSQRTTRMLLLLFLLTFVALLGNSRTSTVFSLLLLLEIQQRNMSLKYA